MGGYHPDRISTASWCLPPRLTDPEKCHTLFNYSPPSSDKNKYQGGALMTSMVIIFFLLAVTVFLFIGRLAELLVRKHRDRLSIRVPRASAVPKLRARPAERPVYRVGLSG
jgi:hypothetical protein